MRTFQTTNDVFIGQQATCCIGSDRYPYVVVKHTNSKKTIWLCELFASPTANHDYYGRQEYTYHAASGEPKQIKATLRKDGRYRKVGARNYETIWLGVAEKYIDPHF